MYVLIEEALSYLIHHTHSQKLSFFSTQYSVGPHKQTRRKTSMLIQFLLSIPCFLRLPVRLLTSVQY